MQAIVNSFRVSESTIRLVVHEDIKYTPWVTRRREFMPNKTRQNCMIRLKYSPKQFKHPKKSNILWFFHEEKKFVQRKKKVNAEMIDSS